MVEVKENKEFKDQKVINGENMKQGWEIKKLGEVCKIQTGKLDANAKVDNGVYPFFTCDAKPYRINTYAFDDKAILISGNGSLVGHINYYNGKFNAYQRTYVLTQFISFYIPFLICYLKGFLRSYIIENKKGGCIPYITLPILQDFTIPCPPLPEQEKIVAELDCLSGIIEKKKEQLKELDALAESIFYTMFGDPITNEKGWEVKKWNDILAIINGKNQKAVENPNGKFPIYGSGGIMGYADEFLCPQNTVIIGRKGNINKPLFVNEPFWNVDTAFGLVANKKDIIAKYLFFYCQIFDFNQLNKAVTIPSLTKSDLLELKMPCPPLTLQQEFATKIDAIEKQKGLIKESIKETETLFNARMQYYFG